ncbi:AlwI family type II restriction endonuclease, partial [Faecalibacterium sp.]|uniref:AlwI family type II restriction endonuclease n=1 Tax=Faecalibacterium sp. TaxID=1971605 RepID=UPI003A95062A
PVTLHYAKLHKLKGKTTYCLFIAPSINRATWAHFFGLNQIKNITAYGGKPKIVPLELDSFMRLIENSYINDGIPRPEDVQKFLQTAIDEIENACDEMDWSNRISAYIDKWLVA